MTKQQMPNYAGLIDYRVRRDSGHVVGVYDGEAAEMDTDAGRWQTVCEEHGTVISHATRAIACSHARSPLDWCEPCRDEKEAAS